jgi:hypothetical protein
LWAPGRSGVEQVEDQLGRAGDDGPVAPDADRTLHQPGVFHQQVDDEVGVDQGRRVDPQVVEGGVPSDKVGRPDAQEAEYRLEGLPVQRVLQVLDGVELDATLLEQVEGAPGLPSARVVVQEQSVVHGRTVVRGPTGDRSPDWVGVPPAP